MYHCPRCLTGKILADLACISCGADFKPVTLAELHKQNMADFWLYPDIPNGFYTDLRLYRSHTRTKKRDLTDPHAV